jgi:hypothetical protein
MRRDTDLLEQSSFLNCILVATAEPTIILSKSLEELTLGAAMTCLTMALAAIDAGAFSKHLESGDDEVG